MVSLALSRSAMFKMATLVGLSSLVLALPTLAFSTAAEPVRPQPTAEEQSLLDQYPAFSEAIHILEENPGGDIHRFLEQNVGATVWLDTTIIRYLPMNKNTLDDPIWRATTDRKDNPVYTNCWKEPDEVVIGIANFGDKGLPLPLDAADIEAGCATHIRFRLLAGEESDANLNITWGDNKLQWLMASFFKIEKTALDDGEILYTLVEQDIPVETRSAFNTYKRVQERPLPILTLGTAQPPDATPSP
ncbi:MAG: hypothetical protein KA176_04625 [Alphaproteobacteria bacterium]|nr:hypothetical protein [Alphaproteobacteria bacterium]MBP7761834.1 hypothetical protein [Alphaproteobacteria bacterium]